MKIVVLGSDYFTLPVVKTAREMGHYVIVTDLMESSPSKEAANEAWMISTADIDSLDSQCRENSIDAVICGASDFNVGNLRKLCKRLGVPLYCENERAWETSRNKYLFKQACIKNGVPVAADFSFVGNLSEDLRKQIRYPVVVKPVDLSGNRGISFCENEQELLEAIRLVREMSEHTEIVVERMLHGTEHHVNYAVQNGQAQLVSFAETNHAHDQASNIYSFEKTSSRLLKQYLMEVNEPLKKTFAEIGCTEGIVWVDTIRDEDDGKFYVLEMGYRFAAALATCPVVEKVSGFNPIRWMIESSLGISHMGVSAPLEQTRRFQGSAGLLHMWVKKNGKISRIEGLDILSHMENVFVDMPKREGATVRAFSCIALISFHASDCEEMISTMRSINESFKVFDEEGNNIVIYYEDYENVARTYHE